MLEMRPFCENCEKPLPNESDEAMICSYECTFCSDCVHDILHNVCPNCGGGFTPRPTRPTNCLTGNCVENHPVSTKKIHKPVNMGHFKAILSTFSPIDPRKR